MRKNWHFDLVEWEDSYGCSPRWEDFSLPTINGLTCRSVGWLISQNDRNILIAPHVAENEALGIKQACGDMTIPRAAILKVIKIFI